MTNETRTLEIHFRYCIGILTSIIILIATYKWTDIPDFTNYLSNAATMTSLMLGLVAIFYSFISNAGLSKSLGNIEDISDDIRASKDQVSEFIELTKSSTESARHNTESIERFSNDINITLTALRSTLDDVKTETAALNSSITAIPTRFDQLESRFRLIGEKPTVSNYSATDISDDAVKRFLEVTSLAGNLFTYACVLAKATQKNLSISTFCQATEISLENFLSGFMQCMYGINLIRRSEISGQPKTYNLTFCNKYLEDNSKKYIADYIEKRYADRVEDLEMWRLRLKKVEDMFS